MPSNSLHRRVFRYMFRIILCQVHMLWSLLLSLLNWANILLSGGIYCKTLIDQLSTYSRGSSKALATVTAIIDGTGRSVLLIRYFSEQSFELGGVKPLSSISPFQHWSSHWSIVGGSPCRRRPLEPHLLHARRLRRVQPPLPLQVGKEYAWTMNIDFGICTGFPLIATNQLLLLRLTKRELSSLLHSWRSPHRSPSYSSINS